MTSFLRMVFFRNLNPHRADPRSSLARRFPSERIAVVNFGSMGAKVGSVRFVKGVPHLDNVLLLHSDTADQLPSALIPALRDRSATGAVVLGCSLKAIFNLQKLDPSDMDAMASFNGDIRDPSHYAQVLPSVESEKTIRGLLERSLIGQMAEKFREHGLDIVRCQIPSISILNCMLADPLITTPPDGTVNIPLVCDQGMLHAVSVLKGRWVAQRCTTVVSRATTSRRNDEDDEIVDVLNSCRRSIDQTFPARDSSSRPTRYNFMVIDTETPAMFDRITNGALQLSGPKASGVTITVERFTNDLNPDLYCLASDPKAST